MKTTPLNNDEEVISIHTGQTVKITDSLTVQLNAFSHKRPFTGGPTKTTAYLTVTKNNQQDKITLSVHGTEGRNESRYESLEWNGYLFQLKEFTYDESIKLMISKK